VDLLWPGSGVFSVIAKPESAPGTGSRLPASREDPIISSPSLQSSVVHVKPIEHSRHMSRGLCIWCCLGFFRAGSAAILRHVKIRAEAREFSTTSTSASDGPSGVRIGSSVEFGAKTLASQPTSSRLGRENRPLERLTLLGEPARTVLGGTGVLTPLAYLAITSVQITATDMQPNRSLAIDHSRSKDMQARHGCSVCGWAGSSAHGKSMMPGLNPSQLEELRSSGRRIYCVWFKRPVDADEGRNCSGFRLNH
jgi:hypothetical protein